MLLEENRVYELKNQPNQILVKVTSTKIHLTTCKEQFLCVPATIISSGESVLIPLKMLKYHEQGKNEN